MDLAGWLVERARESGLLASIENAARQYADNLREKEAARQRQSQRDVVLDAISRQSLTRLNAIEILQLAEPSLFTAEEALQILSVLHVASNNNRAGRRPVILTPVQNPWANFSLWLKALKDVEDPQTTALDRIKLAKELKSWPFVVERLYRGELKVAQIKASRSDDFGHEKPSGIARRIVANATMLSEAVVKRHCDAVTRENRRFPEDTRKPMLISEFDWWLEAGGPMPD